MRTWLQFFSQGGQRVSLAGLTLALAGVLAGCGGGTEVAAGKSAEQAANTQSPADGSNRATPNIRCAP